MTTIDGYRALSDERGWYLECKLCGMCGPSRGDLTWVDLLREAKAHRAVCTEAVA